MKKLVLVLSLVFVLFGGLTECKSQNFFWSYQQPTVSGGYGALYNWYAATDSRKITSSDDWVVPNYTQLTTLSTYLGGTSIAGGKLKETGLVYWNTPNTGATNEVGFNGRGAGYRQYPTGDMELFKIQSYYMGADSFYCYFMQLTNTSTSASIGSGSGDPIKKLGISMRLLYTGSGTPISYTGNDGKVYIAVTIGTQTWIADNLAETKYRNGDYIHGFDGGVYTPISNTDWASLTTGAMCYYNNDISNQ